MEIIKSFIENNLQSETNEEPLFRASEIGYMLEMANIRVCTQHFDETEKTIKTVQSSTGPKQVTFLTEKGLYKILFKSRKPIAETLINWVCNVIKEIRLNGSYNLQTKLENQKMMIETNKNIEMREKIVEHTELENERTLLDKFANIGSIIYIIRVKTYENGTYVIKIGESRHGIRGRYLEHKSNYEECLLMNCFQVIRSRDFEHSLHHNPLIRPNKVTNLENHERENELFLIGQNLTYQMILKIINNTIDSYNYTVRELLLEIELLKCRNSQPFNVNPEILQEFMQTNKLLVESNAKLTEKVLLLENSVNQLLKCDMIFKNEIVTICEETKTNKNEEEPSKCKLVTGFNQQIPNLGPRLQKINPETFQLVQVYECVTDAMNENTDIKRPSIMKAINENTIYRGFRWLLVARNDDPNVIHLIEPTKVISEKNIGYIAKLNSDKSEILNVYLDRKTAATLNNYQSSSALDNPVKNETLSKGNYYILYEKCNENLIENFEEQYGEPLLYKCGVGQYDLNNNLIKTFENKFTCLKTLKMSDKTLTKALLNNTQYNGYYYREIGAKLSMC